MAAVAYARCVLNVGEGCKKVCIEALPRRRTALENPACSAAAATASFFLVIWDVVAAAAELVSHVCISQPREARGYNIYSSGVAGKCTQASYVRRY